MLPRFNLSTAAMIAGFLALAVTLPGSAPVRAATIGIVPLGQAAVQPLAMPVHCKKYLHWHKRCRYCRPVRHRCPKKNPAR